MNAADQLIDLTFNGDTNGQKLRLNIGGTYATDSEVWSQADQLIAGWDYTGERAGISRSSVLLYGNFGILYRIRASGSPWSSTSNRAVFIIRPRGDSQAWRPQLLSTDVDTTQGAYTNHITNNPSDSLNYVVFDGRWGYTQKTIWMRYMQVLGSSTPDYLLFHTFLP